MKVRIALVVALLVFGACGNLFDTAAAVVNGHKITEAEIDEGLTKFTATDEYKRLASQGDAQAIQRQFLQAYITQLIRRSVMEPEADDLGIDVSDDEVDARIEEIKNDF